MLFFLNSAACMAQAVDLKWLIDGTECSKNLDALTRSNIEKEKIIHELERTLKDVMINSINVQCIYPTVIRYKDESLISIFKKRMNVNSEENIIDSKYLDDLKSNNVPEIIINKISNLKGKRFRTFDDYESYLKKILTVEEMRMHGSSIIYCNRTDPFNYSADLYDLLLNKNIRFEEETIFIKECLKLRHLFSCSYFIDLHINDLPVKSRLSVISTLTKGKFKNSSIFPYIATSILEDIHNKYPEQYMDYINSIKTKGNNVPYEFTCVLNANCP